MQHPSVGRMVHYQSFGTPGGEFQSEPRAAIITKVHNATCVDLCVLNPNGMFFNQNVVQGSGGGKWDWPPRLEEHNIPATPINIDGIEASAASIIAMAAEDIGFPGKR